MAKTTNLSNRLESDQVRFSRAHHKSYRWFWHSRDLFPSFSIEHDTNIEVSNLSMNFDQMVKSNNVGDYSNVRVIFGSIWFYFRLFFSYRN